MQRRTFIHSLGALSAVGAGAGLPAMAIGVDAHAESDRDYWVRTLTKVADPLLVSLSHGTLKAEMPVEARTKELAAVRKKFTHLEGFGRLLCGMAPWFEIPPDGTEEGKLRTRYVSLAQQSLAHMVDPRSNDLIDFSAGDQCLVDAAFLALAFVRSPRLWMGTDDAVKKRILSALRTTRAIKPYPNNWLLFSAMIETFFLTIGEEYDRMRIDYALRQHEQWYKGDGIFGDGAEFHWDYYNSYVTQPFMAVILPLIAAVDAAYAPLSERCAKAAVRYAAILEKLIAPDGSFPAIGRSIAYRCGAFHHLAQQALVKKLPADATGAQVRSALTAVIHRTLDDPKNFDAHQWLRPGLCAYQPGLAEDYISTGSLYLCATAFLPLGLSAADEFWRPPSVPWSSVKLWSGENMSADKALKL